MKVEIPSCGHRVNGPSMAESGGEHVEGGVPPSQDILQHHTMGKAMSSHSVVPSWEEDSCRVFESKGHLVQLSISQSM